MRSVPDDRTARAVIWDEALRLFADRGPDGVSVRQILAADAVSPGLVVHHFGSKEGLRQAVDEHGLGLFDRMLGVVTGEDAAGLYDPAAPGPAAEVIVKHLPAGSPVPGYLRRLLLADGDTGRELFRRLFQLSAPTLDAQAAAGPCGPGGVLAGQRPGRAAAGPSDRGARHRPAVRPGHDPLGQRGPHDLRCRDAGAPPPLGALTAGRASANEQKGAPMGPLAAAALVAVR